MMKTKARKTRVVFAPVGQGPLALEARAFGAEYEPYDMPTTAAASSAPVRELCVRGPLMHHLSKDFGSYEALELCVAAEIDAGVRVLIVNYDSPGGLVSGCFDAAERIQAMCRAAGVTHFAYVGNQCCSAAYALACGADRIFAPPASSSGSVGVIEPLADSTKQAEMVGVKFQLITSGARKADGNPMAEITPEVIAARQEYVDDLADVFFKWVAQNRPGLNVEGVRALQAGSYAGARAVSVGLVDAVMDLSALKKLVAQALEAGDDLAGNLLVAEKPAEYSTKDPPMSLARKALQAIIDDDKAPDEDKEEAKAALAALPDEDGGDDKDGAADEDADKDKAKAEDEKKDAEAAAAAAKGNPLLAKALATAGAALQGDERKAVAELLKSRPDFDKALAVALKDQPLAVVRHYVKTMPKKIVQSPVKAARAALAGARPTTAAREVGGSPQTALPGSPMQAAAQVGGGTMATKSCTVVDKGHTLVFSAMRPRVTLQPAAAVE